MDPIVCDLCGASAPGEVPPLTWTTAIEDGALRRSCDTCSRAHLRSMEGKLDPSWW